MRKAAGVRRNVALPIDADNAAADRLDALLAARPDLVQAISNFQTEVRDGRRYQKRVR